MSIGPFVNGAAIFLGSVLGASLGGHIPRRISERLPLVFGCVAMGLGISMITKVVSMPPVVLALIIGTILGEIIGVERGFRALARFARKGVDIITPKRYAAKAREKTNESTYIETFVSATVLFCFSGVGILGSLTEGMTGDPTLLLIKAIMDVFTAPIFAITLGYAVATLALPQIAVQMALLLSASLILPLTTPAMTADFTACGGFIMVATGFTISGIKTFPLSSMLPALVLVMPLSALWLRYAP
ncbi:MAG: DUF554 domain-containing protein [Rhodospirillaceae bacterium]|nr:DUF554 domain-containing protein [Rhodospirillaceae bacterium]